MKLSAPRKLGSIGIIWTLQLDHQPTAKAQEGAAELEQLGFGAMWAGIGSDSLELN